MSCDGGREHGCRGGRAQKDDQRRFDQPPRGPRTGAAGTEHSRTSGVSRCRVGGARADDAQPHGSVAPNVRRRLAVRSWTLPASPRSRNGRGPDVGYLEFGERDGLSARRSTVTATVQGRRTLRRLACDTILTWTTARRRGSRKAPTSAVWRGRSAASSTSCSSSADARARCESVIHSQARRDGGSCQMRPRQVRMPDLEDGAGTTLAHDHRGDEVVGRQRARDGRREA